MLRCTSREVWLALFVSMIGVAAAEADDVLPNLTSPDYPATPSQAFTAPRSTIPPPPNPMPPGQTMSTSVTPTGSVLAPETTAGPAPAVPWTSPQPAPVPQISAPQPPSGNNAVLGPVWVALPIPRSDIYAQVDYFTWKESVDSSPGIEETGPLVTLGYLYEGFHSRFRAELFGGDVNYDGTTMDGVPLDSDTGYIGARFEGDLLTRLPRPGGFVELFGGLGTRFWSRDVNGGWDALGEPVISCREDWWTVYCYGGFGVSRAISPRWELYGRARAGATILTQEQTSLGVGNLQPRPGFTGAMEFGLRGKCLNVALRMETMAWAESREAIIFTDGYWWGVYQPKSTMSTIGLSAAYSF